MAINQWLAFMRVTTTRLRFWLNIAAIVIFLGALLASLAMTSDALRNSARFDRLYTLLLLVNVLALVTLFTLIGVNLWHLISQVRGKQAGARLTVRLLSLMIILSVAPVAVVYYFSLEFLNQRLDSWFDVNIEKALDNALTLSRATLDTRMREAYKQTQLAADDLALDNDDSASLYLNELRARSGASEMTLLAPNGQIIAFDAAETAQLLPHRPSENVLLQLKQTDSYVNLDNIEGHGSYIRVTIKVVQAKYVRLLHALYPVTESLNELANNVETAYIEYKERSYLQKPLKWSFTLVLSLVLLFTIFGAVWIAFFAAQRFVEPISDLAAATQSVARGNYGTQLTVTELDELGFLVSSFNEMSRKIAQARDAVRQSQQLAESQRIYLEAVLSRLSSGVISLDAENRLLTANTAAEQILGVPLSELLEQRLGNLLDKYPTLQFLCDSIRAHTHNLDWREEIVLFGESGRKVLMCRGTQLEFSQDQQALNGEVIVFDDITTLIQAQRTAAWSEVARRLAHEIKNPLTPIQLSAERLRHKYLRTLPEKEAETLDRLTHTIIQQVDNMKEMVNAFSDYARTPVMKFQTIQFNQLVKEVLDLYQSTMTPIEEILDLYDHPLSQFQLHLAENLPNIQADKGRLRQVLHNLIKNALEATPHPNIVTVTTQWVSHANLEQVELRVQDQGVGVPVEKLDSVFEPYVTTKAKGTGLGLAIVKKIVDEHGGTVWIENHGGACVVVRLPVQKLVEV